MSAKKGQVGNLALPEKVDADLIKIYMKEEEEKAQVLSRAINWDSFLNAYVTKEELDLVKQYDRKSTDKAEMLHKYGTDLARILMVFLAKLAKDDDIKYVLSLVEDTIKLKDVESDAPEVLKVFERLRKSEPIQGVPKLPFGPLMSLLTRKDDDDYIVAKSCSVITIFMEHFHTVDHDIVEGFLRWSVEQLTKCAVDAPGGRTYKSVERRLSVVLVSLRSFLSNNKYRDEFEQEGGIAPLLQLCHYNEDNLNPQKMYEAIYVLWLLSFNKKVKEKLTDPKLIFNLVHILRRSTKDKVIRIAAATLRNLLGVAKNNELMISYGLMKSLELLIQKKWNDEDLEDDIKELHEVLTNNVDELTSFDKYKYEVESGKLEWSPPHKSERFWTENCLKFEEDNHTLLRTLKELIETSKDKKVIAIACWDIGEFVRFHPLGKLIVQQNEIKLPIMKLLNDQDDMVRKEALVALQKLMVSKWEYLQ